MRRTATDQSEKIRNILLRAKNAHKAYLKKLARESAKGDVEALELIQDEKFLEQAGWIEPAVSSS